MSRGDFLHGLITVKLLETLKILESYYQTKLPRFT